MLAEHPVAVQRTLNLFEVCGGNGAVSLVPQGRFHVSDNYPIGEKQNVNNSDSALHARGDFRGGWSNFMLSTIEFGEFFNSEHVQQNFHSCTITATFEKQRILKAKETCENQFDNNKANSLFTARRNLLQRCERKMNVASQKDKNKLIALRSIIFQLY